MSAKRPRLNIDLAPEYTAALKTAAAKRGLKPVELVREWIESQFGKELKEVKKIQNNS